MLIGQCKNFSANQTSRDLNPQKSKSFSVAVQGDERKIRELRRLSNQKTCICAKNFNFFWLNITFVHFEMVKTRSRAAVPSVFYKKSKVS